MMRSGSVCALLLAVGLYVLPLLGPARPEFVFQPVALGAVALCAALAATGFGMLLGTVAGSHEQASIAGAVSVIIAAAMGGVMVPAYAMPRMLRDLTILSPLNWGLDAFLEALTRQSGLAAVAPDLVRLLGFFLATVGLALAWVRLRRA